MGEGKGGGRVAGGGGAGRGRSCAQQHLWGGDAQPWPRTALPREAPREGLKAFGVRPPAAGDQRWLHRNGGWR